MEPTDQSAQLMRWRLHLAKYNFYIFRKKRLLSRQEDVLSRLESGGHATEVEDLKLPSLDSGVISMKERNIPEEISITVLLRLQATDDICQNIRGELESGRTVSFPKASKTEL